MSVLERIARDHSVKQAIAEFNAARASLMVLASLDAMERYAIAIARRNAALLEMGVI